MADPQQELELMFVEHCGKMSGVRSVKILPTESVDALRQAIGSKIGIPDIRLYKVSGITPFLLESVPGS